MVTGETSKNPFPHRLNRRKFEVCFCRQLIQKLKSAHICVPGETYSDARDQLLSMIESQSTPKRKIPPGQKYLPNITGHLLFREMALLIKHAILLVFSLTSFKTKFR
ncbi:hypothetical protein BJP43_05120 [Candidatus Williamhamiltonella defendens]|uniref:Uncharacterized protein n=1 Tax=Candidatus Williamhamiltonella defendens TaxID=138072 RepID=A0A2D3TD67_9ENTR|nr:hypothetical protein BJP43_05120 [Candidatus Hamiltonella defensa]AYB48215.1 hypothetical protein CJJ19_00100 [Candidatus Hamiltonella defensa]